MKKLVLLLSFVFVLGLVSVNAQDPKKPATKTPAKTEQTTKKKAGKSKKGKTAKKKKAAAATTTPKAAK